MKIGERINSIRKEKKMTLQELSEKSGVALATLSRIENDKMTGTLESHMNIARALELTLPQLYSDIEAEEKVVDVHNGSGPADVYVSNEKVSFDILTQNILSKKMMPILLKIAPGEQSKPEKAKVGTEKFVYVLKGKIEIAIDTVKHALYEGDSIYFNASSSHSLKNAGTEEAKCLCIMTPPAL